jgi:hypothetical protein
VIVLIGTLLGARGASNPNGSFVKILLLSYFVGKAGVSSVSRAMTSRISFLVSRVESRARNLAMAKRLDLLASVRSSQKNRYRATNRIFEIRLPAKNISIAALSLGITFSRSSASDATTTVASRSGRPVHQVMP